MSPLVDVHAHLFTQDSQLGDPFASQATRARGSEVSLIPPADAYRRSAPEDTIAVVFGGKARRSGIWVPDETIAQFAAANPHSCIGFMSLDPTQAGWQQELRTGHAELGLRGIKIMPMYAGFDPRHRDFDELWSNAIELGLPVLAHTGTTFVSDAVLDYARPGLFDEVARRFPQLRLVLAHLGHPYQGECLAVIRKHEHVYADLSALHYRPYQLWHGLKLAQEYAVTHKLLFGSDFPFTTVNDSITGLHRIVTEPGPFGPIGTDMLEQLLARDTLRLLGLPDPRPIGDAR